MNIFKNLSTILCLLFLTLTPSLGHADMKAGDEAYSANDFVRAFEEWMKEAEAGNPVAQNNVGFLYRKALGVVVNWEEAARWYRRAAEQGLAAGMTNLGKLLDEGEGVQQDLIESYKWFFLAAERGAPGAAAHLQILRDDFLTAIQVEEAIQRAKKWQPKAETGVSPNEKQ